MPRLMSQMILSSTAACAAPPPTSGGRARRELVVVGADACAAGELVAEGLEGTAERGETRVAIQPSMTTGATVEHLRLGAEEDQVERRRNHRVIVHEDLAITASPGCAAASAASRTR